MKSLLSSAFMAALFLLASSGESNAQSDAATAERARIREHLSSVEAYLRSQDTLHLTPALREARSKNIARLHEYWTAGVFPRNTLRDYPTPIFIDPAGRACAVGYLMIESGWGEAAEKVADEENLAYVNEIRTPEVAEWLGQSGLTAQEAAWIQPTYGPYCWDDCPCDEAPVCGADGITYLNPCFAEECGDQDTYVSGCCAVDQAPRVEGAALCRCTATIEIPEECEDESYFNGADLCVDFVDPPPPPGASSGCAAVPASSGAIGWFLLLLVGVLLRPRRRQH